MTNTNSTRRPVPPPAGPNEETVIMPQVGAEHLTPMQLPGTDELLAAKDDIANGVHSGDRIFQDLVAKRGADFESFLHDLIHREAPEIMRKAGEYGSNSLAEMGHLFGKMRGLELSKAEALELGCFVYAFGKVQRIQDAVLKGKAPSDDTIKDAWVYLGMMMYIREYKNWP